MFHIVIGGAVLLSPNDFSQKKIMFLVTKDGQKLSFKNDNVVVKNKDGMIICQTSCYRLFALFVVGHITITSGLIQRAKKFGFSIMFLTTSFRPYQAISSFAEGNTILRRSQYNYSSIKSGISLVKNKMINQRFLLMSIRNKNHDLQKTIACIDRYLKNIDNCDSIQSIMGIEGSASKIYFKYYFDNVVWKGRKPRVKFDMTNALLDIGYTLLFSYIDCLTAIFGFDRYVGLLHRQFYMRKSLVCDLVEPFRVIIDKQVKKSINLGQFKEKDFEIFDGKWCLKYKKSSEYSQIFMTAILKHKNELFLYVRDVYRCFMQNKLDSDFPVWRFDNDIS